MRQWIASGLLAFGTVFTFLAAYGVLRLPDSLTRMQATSKATTLGIGSVMLAVAFAFDDVAVRTKAALVVLFLFVTQPIAAHLVARAAYRSGAPLWEGTVADELGEDSEDSGGPASQREP
ncbi:MAG: monovalent cation/H(+) antiporter subunit G [Fimbriimonadales bacterium]|nr:monovalent cation/H(+) antiporter subunit G [Fimbriimonadales bacterium]